MSDWGWVAFAFGVTYASMAAYAGLVVMRARRTRRRLEELQ